MTTLQKTTTQSISIAAAPARVYEYVHDGANLPKWAFFTAATAAGAGWLVDTPDGQMTLHFSPRNDLGVLDHHVEMADGSRSYVPMRVIPNGTGSEVMLTLLQAEGMPDEVFVAFAKLVESDLAKLKSILESP